MIRRKPLTRTAALARKSGIPRRAIERAGTTLGERDSLDRLARTVVMLAAGASLLREGSRESWRGRCQHCGKDAALSWCHVITRATWGTRWDVDNAFAACSGCHRMLDQHWQQKEAWISGRLGEARWRMLLLRAHAGRKPDLAGVRLHLLAEGAKLLGVERWNGEIPT